jgi:hypothetical protein
MPTSDSSIPLSEQLKNARYVISVADQPVVAAVIAELGRREHARHQPAPSPEIPRPASKAHARHITLSKALDKALPPPKKRFTYLDLSRSLDETGYKFTAKNRRTAIGHILADWTQSGKITLVERGKGGNPNVYEVP